MKKKILFITTSRSDYGSCKNLISLLIVKKDFYLAVSGTHLSKNFGETIQEIKKDGITIFKKVDILRNSKNKLNDAKLLITLLNILKIFLKR